MKVAIIATGLDCIKRGVESWAYCHAYALKGFGIDARLYKGSGKPKSGIEERVPCLYRGSAGNKVVYNIFSKLGGWRYRLGNPYEVEQVTFCLGLLFTKIVKLRQFDIIHLQDPIVADFLQSARKAGLIKAKTILGYGTGDEYKFIKTFDYLQVFTPYYLEEIKRKGFKNHKVYMIPHYVDTDRFKPALSGEGRSELGIPADAFVILSVSAIKKSHKRTDWLVEEVCRLLEKDKDLKKRIFLIIAGAIEKETAEIMDLVKRSDASDNIKFLPNVPFSSMPDIYNLADVFTLGSLIELFGIVIIEALASGLPVIANEHPSFRWIISDGGDCIDMTKEHELSSTIKKYLDKDYLGRKKRNARENAEKRFSEKAVLGQILDMYKDILNN